MKSPRTCGEVASSSCSRCTSGKQRWYFFTSLLLLYALVLQIGLGGLVEGTRTASLAGLPAELMLCQPGKIVDGPATPVQDHGPHDGTCCLAACATRLVGGPLPSPGEPLAWQPVIAARRPGFLPDTPLAIGPALHPLSARGPPLTA